MESENISRALYDCAAIMNANIKSRSRSFCVGAKDFGELRPSVRTNSTSQQRGKSTSLNSVGHPDPHDPHVFGPSGSGSVSQRY
jgi:hypothetical protein